LLVGLSAVTITDANPFHKAHSRQKLLNARWVKAPTEKGLPVDGLFELNVTNYSDLVGSCYAAAIKIGPLLPKLPAPGMEVVESRVEVPESQLSFWPVEPNYSEPNQVSA
jgi:hypothetical protein